MMLTADQIIKVMHMEQSIANHRRSPLDARTEGFKAGIRAAAAFAGEFDKQIDHPCRFEDVILRKFKMLPGKPRRKKQPAKSK